MHHGGRRKAVGTATGVNLCSAFFGIFIGGLLRNKYVQKHGAETRVWGLRNKRGLPPPFSAAMGPGSIAVHAATESFPRGYQDAGRCTLDTIIAIGWGIYCNNQPCILSTVGRGRVIPGQHHGHNGHDCQDKHIVRPRPSRTRAAPEPRLPMIRHSFQTK